MPLTADRLRKQLREIHVVFVCNIDGLFAGLPPRILHALRVTEYRHTHHDNKLAVQHLLSLFHRFQIRQCRSFIPDIAQSAVRQDEQKYRNSEYLVHDSKYCVFHALFQKHVQNRVYFRKSFS